MRKEPQQLFDILDYVGKDVLDFWTEYGDRDALDDIGCSLRLAEEEGHDVYDFMLGWRGDFWHDDELVPRIGQKIFKDRLTI